MKTIIELMPLVEKWAEERQIFEKSNSTKQLEKTREEVNELIRDLKTPRDYGKIEKTIKNCFKELILYCTLRKIDYILILEELNSYYNKKHKITPRIIQKQLLNTLKTKEELNLNSITIIFKCLLNSSKHINKNLF